MTGRVVNGRAVRVRASSFRLALLGSVSCVALNCFGDAQAGQLPATAFQPYNPATASSIQPGPFALFQVPVNSLSATQLNVGLFEVGKKTNGFDELTSQSALNANLLTAIEPVVIGPGGILYQTDGHHTFLALTNSGWGGSINPLVDVNVIANFSNLTPQQFWTTMEQDNLLYPVNDGVLQNVNTTTGAPLPNSLSGLTSDVYRGLEYAILKNKSSKLFTTASNVTGAIGSAIPGLDKTAAFYSDFIWADAYRSANGGLGLPYRSPADIALATQWNLNGANQTTLPNVGAVTVSQLPGYILPTSITITGSIGDATLANGTLDGSKTGTFDQSTTFASFNGLRGLNLGPVTIGSNAPGFIMQLGNDLGATVTLGGNNTYTGGTTILAGTLIVNGDASLGAAAPASPIINLNSIAASVEANNGIVFNSLTEGNGTLQIGATATPGVNSFTTNRPIAVDGEVANLNLNGNTLTLTGPIVSLGAISTGISNATGEADLTVEDNSATAKGILVLAPTTGSNPNFYGNWVITSGTLRVSSDASLGNTTGPSFAIGQIDLNGGTFQAGASFSSVRSLFLASGSTFDTNGFTTAFAGNLLNVQRTLTVINSSTTTAGAVSFGSFEVGGTATLNVAGGTAGNSVTFTNGIIREPGATLLLQPTNGAFGTSEKVFDTSSGANATNTVTNGIVTPWIVIYNATPSVPLPTNPFSFATYGSGGFTASSGNSTNILTATANSVVLQSTNITGATVSSNLRAYALSVQNGTGIALNGHTLTLGDGSHPAGLILNGGASITGGTLATGASELVVWLAGKSNNTNTISAQITGSGGLSIAGGLQATNLNLSGANANGSGTLNLNTATAETGAITIDSGVVALNAVNVFFSSIPGVMLADTKKSPSPAILNITQNNAFTALQSVGNNSTVNISNGARLTIGDTTNNLSSVLSSTVAQTGAAVTGALTKNGSGLLDISGSGGVSFSAGSTVVVNGGALRIGNGVFGAGANTVMTLAAGTELQYVGNGGSKFNDPIQGSGIFHLLSGTVQLTGANTYSGGSFIEVGATLDVTTATLPSGGTVTNAGGTLAFDQSTTGTFSGIMSDGRQSGGPNDPFALAALASGPTLSGTLIKDDSTGGNGGNVTIGAVQAYTGGTFIEAGTLTLGVANAIASSAGVDLGRVGGNGTTYTSTTATLALGANNTIQGLMDEKSNASFTNNTFVQLGGNTLTINPLAGTIWSFGGQITGTGGLTINGPGIQALTGASNYTGPTNINNGLLQVTGSIVSSVSVNAGGTLSGTGTVGPTAVNGGTLAPANPGAPLTVNGSLTFNTAATYLVLVTPTLADRTNVSGAASVAGTFAAALSGGTYNFNPYTVLSATGGVSGRFGSAFTSSPFLTANLIYTPSTVALSLSPNFLPFAGGGANQQAVAAALQSGLLAAGGSGGFSPLFQVPQSSFANALAQLSGEVGTTATSAGLGATAQLLTQLLDPFAGDRSDFAATQGRAMGFAPERPAVPDVLLAYARNITKAPPAAPYDGGWSVWGGGFGGESIASGDPVAGSNGVDVHNAGFSTGFDRRLSNDSVVGFALAGGGTNFSMQNGLGGGRGDIFQAAAYGSTRIDQFYLAAAAALGHYELSTARSVNIGSVADQLNASFGAWGLGGRLEAGRRFPVASGFGVTPFAAVQAESMWTPAYSETSVFGTPFGLSFTSQTTDRLRSELGGGIDGRYVSTAGRIWTYYARAAWAHEYLRDTAVNAAFLTLPVAGFSVQGAQPPADAALLTLGSVVGLSHNVALRTKVEGEFGKGSTTYAGTGALQITW